MMSPVVQMTRDPVDLMSPVAEPATANASLELDLRATFHDDGPLLLWGRWHLAQTLPMCLVQDKAVKGKQAPAAAVQASASIPS